MLREDEELKDNILAELVKKDSQDAHQLSVLLNISHSHCYSLCCDLRELKYVDTIETTFINTGKNFIVTLTPPGKHFSQSGRTFVTLFEQEEKRNNLQYRIDELTEKNLKLQNREMKYKVFFAIIGFFAGAVVSNIKDISEFLKQYIR